MVVDILRRTFARPIMSRFPLVSSALGIAALLVGYARGAGSTAPFEWQTATPESQGMSSTKLNALKDSLAAKNTKAFLVIRNDKIVYEWYAKDHSATAKHSTASLAKAIVGGLSLGLALSDGRLALDDKAAKYIPQWKEDPRKSQITIRQLGAHISGLGDASQDGVPHEKLPSWMGDFWKRHDPPNDPFTIARDKTPTVFDPGERLQYSNPGIAMLSHAVTVALKGAPEKDIRTVLRDRIMRPIGAPDEEWACGYGKTFIVDGLPLVASWGGGNYTARAVARIGRLMLRKGDWDGQQLLSKEAVRQITTDAGGPGNCGMGWWTNAKGRYPKLPKDAFWGAGAGDQVLLVIPSLNLIAVRNGQTLDPAAEAVDATAKPKDVFRRFHDPRTKILFEPLIDALTGEAREGFVPLFDGRSLNGWRGAAEHWAAEDGKLVYKAVKPPRGSADLLGLKLLSDRQYADFVLRFDFKLQAGANNGVALRTPLEGDPAFLGMEIQILDNDGWKDLKPFQVHGSIYGVVPAKTGRLKPVGEWNSQEIVCQGRRVRVTVNGEVILNADLDQVGGRTPDGAAHPGLKRARGFIGFLGHTGRVEFRNIRIKEWPLDPEQAKAIAPYAPSPILSSIQWASKDTIVRKANDSDNWPLTWGDDDHLYTAYGDGTGFAPKVPEKLSLGLARIEGGPADFTGVNLRSATGEQKRGDGKAGKKASGMLMVNGVLYMLVRNADSSQLAWSADHGKSWTWSDWKFTGTFGYPTLLSFGKNYAGARDDYVYIYSHDSDSAYQPADRLVLARVPRDRIKERAAYEFFKDLDAKNRPIWTKEIDQRGAVFTHEGRCYRCTVSYHAGWKRYLLCQAGDDGRVQAGFGVFDAPQPWGPWTTVCYVPKWDVPPGEACSFPTKWMSDDGKTLYLVFSGNDSFSVRKGTVVVTDAPAVPPGEPAKNSP